MSKHVKGLIAILAVGGMLTFGLAPAASAHEVHYVPRAAYLHYHRHDVVRPIPPWVRADRAFHHWYLQSRYRYVQHLSWHRLFELYIYDSRYHGHRRHRHAWVDRHGRRIHRHR